MSATNEKSPYKKMKSIRCAFCGYTKKESKMLSTKVVYNNIKYSCCKTCWDRRVCDPQRDFKPVEEIKK